MKIIDVIDIKGKDEDMTPEQRERLAEHFTNLAKGALRGEFKSAIFSARRKVQAVGKDPFNDIDECECLDIELFLKD